MKDDEIQTSEIRRPGPGFDRRDRTVRGFALNGGLPGYMIMASIGGTNLHSEVSFMAGERIFENDLVELENGLWWRVKR